MLHNESMDDSPYQETYFIGIALPPKLDAVIADLKWQLYDKKANMLKPLVPHVTLLHPPSLQGIMPSQLIPRIREAADRYLPFTIELNDIGFFGRQVVFIRAHSHTLVSLQAHLVGLLPPEARALHYKRPYAPHVTLAQKYQPKELDLEDVQRDIRAGLRLPYRFEVTSVASFTRIKPREYAIRPID